MSELPIVEDEALVRRDWVRFAWITFLFTFGFTIYMAAFMNYFKDVQGGDPLKIGGLESLREIPGLLAALTAGTLVALAESRMASLGLIITGVGIGLTAAMPSFWPLVAVTVFWSIGFHLWSTVQPAIVLALAKGLHGGHHMGRMRAVGAIATVAALALGWGLSHVPQASPYGVYFGIAGGAIVAAGLVAARLSEHANFGRRERLIFRREYGLYYLLIFLEGCRRQVFSIFALFTLVAVFDTPLDRVMLLSLVNAVLATLTAPAMGRFIDRVGERLPLTIYALGILTIFIGYGTIPNVWWLYALYVVDNVLFTFSIGFNTYLHRIVRPGELTPSLAMGVTMNHIAAVGLPILGALAWKSSGNYQVPFFIGAGLAFVALVATQWLPAVPVPKQDEEIG